MKEKRKLKFLNIQLFEDQIAHLDKLSENSRDGIGVKKTSRQGIVRLAIDKYLQEVESQEEHY